MPAKYTLAVVVIASFLAWLIANPSFGMDSMDSNSGKKLYVYSRTELLKFLREIGHTEYPLRSVTDITRNSLGTELRIFNGGKKALIISCGGTIKEVDLPSKDTWLNDELQPLAWYDSGIKRVLYKGGRNDLPPYPGNKDADPAGVYFFKVDVKSPTNKDIAIGTSIYSIEAPNLALAKIMEFHGHRIFSKNGKVFIFGDYYQRRDEQWELYIFERKGQELVQVEKVVIPRPRKSPTPFYMEDLSPWADEALFNDTHDFFLYRTGLYTFNLKTHEMKKLGTKPFGGGYGFFLQCDIIKKFKEGLK